MTTEEFWNNYINGDILEIFEIVCDFFSKELPKEFVEHYDVGEVILETRGHHETAKEFEKVIKFSELIKNKQPNLYEEFFQYFDIFLIDYYCFFNESEKVEKAFLNFKSNPLHDFDKYLISMKKLLFYKYINILNDAIIENFKEVDTSDKLIWNASDFLAITKFYITLEDFYNRADKTDFDMQSFSESLVEYRIDFDDKFLSAIEKGMQKKISKEQILSSFLNDRKVFIYTLEMYFLKYMKEKKFPFALSGRLWDKLLEFWEENAEQKRCEPEKYFDININNFEEYLVYLSGDIFIDNKSEMIAVLWGSVYIYDFLNYVEIIDKNTFDNFIKTSKVLKGKVIGQYTSQLWNSNFVHLWEKPDSISMTEFIEEEKIFKKSLTLKHQRFTKLHSKISEELKNIGELSKYIIEGGENIENLNAPDIFNFFDNEQNFEHERDRITETIRTEKKVGRNEPCPCGSGKKYKKCCGK